MMRITILYLLFILLFSHHGISKESKKEQEVSFKSVKEFGAIGNDLKDDSGAIKLAIKSSQFITFEKNKIYLVKKRIVISKNNIIIEGHGATLMMPSSSKSTFIMAVYGNNIKIRNLNFKSLPDQLYYRNKKLETSNVKGIVGKSGIGPFKNLKIENCHFSGLLNGIVTGEVLGVNLSNCTFSACMTSMLIEESSDVTIFNMESDRQNYGNSYYHHLYINNCKRVMVDGLKFYNGGKLANQRKGTAIHINSNNTRDYNSENINIKNVYAENTGGIVMINTHNISLSNIEMKNTEDQIFFIALPENEVVKIDTLKIDNSSLTSYPAIFTAIHKKFPTQLHFNDFTINGPVDIRIGGCKYLLFENGTFNNNLSEHYNNHYFLNFPEKNTAKVKFRNVIFNQSDKHVAKRMIRVGGNNKVHFNHCEFKINHQINSFAKFRENGKIYFDHVKKKGIAALQEKGHYGELYINHLYDMDNDLLKIKQVFNTKGMQTSYQLWKVSKAYHNYNLKEIKCILKETQEPIKGKIFLNGTLKFEIALNSNQKFKPILLNEGDLFELKLENSKKLEVIDLHLKFE